MGKPNSKSAPEKFKNLTRVPSPPPPLGSAPDSSGSEVELGKPGVSQKLFGKQLDSQTPPLSMDPVSDLVP